MMPAALRIPAMYGDPGVPDEAESLARRGVVLVGSVKSAALVDVVARGSPMMRHPPPRGRGRVGSLRPTSDAGAASRVRSRRRS